MMSLAHTIGRLSGKTKIKPEDVPPPTPIHFPPPPIPTPRPPEAGSASDSRICGLVYSIQSVHRPADIKAEHFDALGLHAIYDAEPGDILPDPSCMPDFAAWDRLTVDEAGERDAETKNVLCNGNKSPGCKFYLDRKAELSIPNEDAFRVIRRLSPAKGKPQARLGQTYEVFRGLEMLTCYWEDTAEVPQQSQEAMETREDDGQDLDAQTGKQRQGPSADFYRTMAGSSMPNEMRHGLLVAFIKLVAYEFGCSTASKLETRLQLSAPHPAQHVPQARPPIRKSKIASACAFVFRTPTKRDIVRAGFVDGPIAGISARDSISFVRDAEIHQDLAREVIAALIIAQHRAREGKTEQPIGQGKWWATKPRWGGGPGGPIGREGDFEDAVRSQGTSPPVKKPRKNLSIYDSYRMVRPPAASWDKKTRYEAIGRPADADHDDVFIVSSLFHHISVVRVRVPNKLLAVLDGAAEETERSWGELPMWRSRWFDLFKSEDRIAAFQLLWGVMAYQMRSDTGRSGEESPQMGQAQQAQQTEQSWQARRAQRARLILQQAQQAF